MGFLADFAPIAGSALDAIGSVAGGLFSANQAKKNRAFQERMYNKQVEDNINFWKMQNEYDLPSAQLQRLMDAGLSPLLAYSSGPVQNVATSAPQAAQAPHGAQASANFHTAFGTAMQQAALMSAQLRNMDADTETKLQEALLKAEETVKTKEESGRIKSETEYNIRSLRDRLEAVRIQNRLNNALAQEPEWKIKEIQANIENLQQNKEWLSQQVVSNRMMTEQSIKESNQRIENSIKETAAAVAKMNAEARKAVADALYADAMRITENSSRQYKVLKIGMDMRKSLLEGDEQEIMNALNQFILDQKPAEGSGAYEYQKFLNQYVNPLFESVGRVFGGTATWSIKPGPKK